MSSRLGSLPLTLALALAAGCSQLCAHPILNPNDAGTAGEGEGEGGNGGACAPCATSADCTHGACVQIGGDDFCALGCTTTADCATGSTCGPTVSFDGLQVNACLPNNGACSGTGCGTCPANQICDTATATCVDSQTQTGACGTLVPPTTAAQCTSCPQGSQPDCQQNGCYGGWYCDTSTNNCHSPPSTCPGDGSGTGDCAGLVPPDSPSSSCTTCTPGSGDCQNNGCFGGWYCNTNTSKCNPPPADCGSSGGVDAGPEPDAGPIEGSVTSNGGAVSRMFFAVVGDTRPPNEDQTSSYPTSIINKIYSDIDALSPKPQFVLTTGDYMFANPSGVEGAAQIALYQSAMSSFSNGPHLGVMGNHECTGYTAGNCANNLTKNMKAYESTFMTPNGFSTPYFVVPFHAEDNSWTAKLVGIACNAWDTTQKAWLTQQMATSTTYTIVSRHEPSEANTAPCVTDSDNIINAAGFDLSIVGHTHTFRRNGKEIVVGNGGAPLTSSAGYGFATVEMIPGTGFRVVEYDATSALPVDTFTVLGH
jgi:hypothetical protein